MPDIRIDESRYINVGGFVFALSQSGNTKDLAKSLIEELLGPIDDIPLRFFSVKKKWSYCSNDKISLLTSANYGDIEARQKENL